MEIIIGREYKYVGRLSNVCNKVITNTKGDEVLFENDKVNNGGWLFHISYVKDNYELVPLKSEGGTSPMNLQASGSHYKKEGIQPIEYIAANKLDYKQGNVIKYIQRHAKKNKEKDLAKALHYTFLMMEEHYGLSVEGSLKTMGYDVNDKK
tara:strand:- start:380 stop:832 length:453 start_codon:yes stop_codon:yes gene_type:complete